MNLDDIYSILSDYGYKLTRQRKVLIDIFIKKRDLFLSVEDIQNEINKNGMNLDLSTIYRNLSVLENSNLICKIQKENSNLYKIRTTKKHHHHLICKGCGKAVTFEYCPTDVFTSIAEKNGYTFTDDKIELYGYCNKCKNTL
ncbi:MAG: Fur family transcriptional regulator [Bacillota bacterium]|nr:Fur family transcriptional regulator [Bacillota bacterium]